jgi:hypothetical protein
MPKWEYKEISGTSLERELNKLGEEGWELVAVVIDAEFLPRFHAFLKREKS